MPPDDAVATAGPKLRALAERWAIARPAERANAQSYLIELCESLGVERPRPAGGRDGGHDGGATLFYEFEHPVRVVARDGTQEGVGLGLAISRDLARGMGAELVAESVRDVGSSFTRVLPLA